MVGFGNWVDAHGHLADERWSALGEVRQDTAIFEAMQQGIGYFMQGGVGPEDWLRQKKLKERHPRQIGLCFGLHPYWVAAHSRAECEHALDLLAPLIPEALGLGEMGLDFRPHLVGEGHSLQLEVFENQIELAGAFHKPMVLHVVQAHDEALRLFDIWGVPASGGLVHSFNGSVQKAQDFLKRGLMLSVGGPVCRPDNQRLHQAVKEIPLESLLIETDSPDQPPPRFKGQMNPPQSLRDVASAIGELKSLDPTEILDICSSNFRRLFSGNEFDPPSSPGI